MATFASRGLSEKDEDEEKEKSEKDVLGIVKTGPKKLTTGESSSLFKLKNELLKRKDNLEAQHKVKSSGTHVTGKSNLLSTKKEEKERQDREAESRNHRIAKNERALRREEDEERLRAAQQKLREKSELYDRMQEGKVVLANGDDDTPVEFLVDFGTKKRKFEEEREMERERYREQETAAPVGFGRAPIPEHYHHSEEQRVFGTSHMRLSLNENKRREEIDKLLEMSKKTDEEVARRKEEKRKKDAARREKINNLRVKHGLEPLAQPAAAPPPPEIDLNSIPMPGQKETPEERHARLMKSDREWDRGKGMYTTWIEKERDDRDDEFRPPDSYFR